MILLIKLVKPFEHLLASDHKCLFLKLFYSANHLSIAAFNITPNTQQAYFILDGMDEDGGSTWCQPLRGATRCY